ncbi:MAG: glycosyltransferase [Gammaproteobacteria bacterium]|nr:glycosyltransferase [Gammaproteobacteria bacterium]
MTQTYFNLDVGFPEVFYVGEGNVQLVRGWCFHPRWQIEEIWLVIGQDSFRVERTKEPRIDVAYHYRDIDHNGHALHSGFYGVIPIAKDLGETHQVIRLRLEFKTKVVEEHELGSVHLVRETRAPIKTRNDGNRSQPLVAICLPTFNPDVGRFVKQVESIKNQTYENWCCIVNDDASPNDKYAEINSICGGDDRFHVYRNRERLGFYHNFEQCLKKVPTSAAFIALSDQDDYWYPDKLEKCIRAFEENTVLVYCDMRVVTDRDDIIAESFWNSRKNNYEDLDILLLSNSITAAAAVFRFQLLDRILPFPEKFRLSFHDHWIACVALVSGKIRYIDVCLYDYIQHDKNVIGYVNGDGADRGQIFSKLWQPWHYLRYLRGTAQYLAGLKRRHLDVYQNEYLMLVVMSSVLRLRFPTVGRMQRQALAIFSDDWRTVFSLLGVHVKVRWRGMTTAGAEIILVMAFMAKTISSISAKVFKRRLMRKIRCEQWSEDSTH